MSKQKAYLASLIYAIVVGLSFLVTKITVPYASSILILAHRFTIAFITYLIFLFINKPKMLFTKKKVISLLPITIFYPILFFALQVFGLKTTSSTNAGIINATVPIITIIIFALLGNKPSKVQILSVFLSVSGVLIIFSNNFNSLGGNIIGIILLLISAISFAIYSILVKKILKNVTVHELTFIVVSSGFIIFNILFIFEQGNFNNILSVYISSLSEQKYFFSLFYLGAFASVGASFASNFSLQTLSPPQFSVFSNLSTLISIVAGVVILKEPISIYYYIGSILIIGGVLGTNFSDSITNKLKIKDK